MSSSFLLILYDKNFWVLIVSSSRPKNSQFIKHDDIMDHKFNKEFTYCCCSEKFWQEISKIKLSNVLTFHLLLNTPNIRLKSLALTQFTKFLLSDRQHLLSAFKDMKLNFMFFFCFFMLMQKIFYYLHSCFNCHMYFNT